MPGKENCDVVILGAGPAGMSAGIYASRGNLDTVILDKTMFGGQPTNYGEIENYPGFSTISGFELAEKFEEHLDKFNVKKHSYVEINSVNLLPEIKTITTNDCEFCAKSVIIATGAHPRKLGIKGETKFIGRGVSYCAVCDAAFYRDKTVCVVGGGNSALEEACYLTKFANRVYLIHRRDEFRADKIVVEKAEDNPKIEFVLSASPIEINGNDKVETLVIKTNSGETCEISTDGVFPYIGIEPETEYFKSQLQLDDGGFIVTDQNMQTSIPGVYAAGDVRTTPLRQVITAVSDGAVAACYCAKYIDSLARKTGVL